MGVVIGLLVGCTGDPQPATSPSVGADARPPGVSTPRGPALTWTRQQLPEGSDALTLTPSGDRVLVGAELRVAGPDGAHPRMYAVDASGRAELVPLTPSSPYAFLARWYSVVTDGTRVVAIGGATGGAHGNVRWTTWAGTTAGLREQTQNFLTFGGEDAGQLLDAVLTPGGPVLVGTWASTRAGQDAAIWLQDNEIWRRQSSSGTALQSTATALVGPHSATSSGPGIVIAGSSVHLGAGTVSQSAAVWRSSGPDTGWHRIDLPDAGQASEAVSVRCDGLHCLAAGRVDGALALWDVAGDEATRLTGIPALALSDQALLPAPLSFGGHDTLVAPAGPTTVVLTRTDHGWTSSPGPTGMPVRATVVGTHLWVTTAQSVGAPTTLWHTES